MAEPGKPLETEDDKHEYGAYLFFLYLTKFYDSGQSIRTIWNNTAQYGSLEAVEQAIPGGFEERWGPFAACLWNEPPSDCFAQWDGVQQAAANAVAAQDVDMGAATISRSLELTDVSVEHMATSYRRFTFTDDRIHSIAFKNTLVGSPHAAVQALAKIDGQWQGPLDWTGNATTTFCRDVAAQHIEELVVIISNSDWETKGKLQPASPPVLTVSTAGCSIVTLSWDTDVDPDLWVLPQPASNPGEALAQYDQPGYGVNPSGSCDQSSSQTARPKAIGGVTADAHYIAVSFYWYCSPPYTQFPFTITIQYADGRVDLVSSLSKTFLLFGPYDFAPPQ